MPERRETGPTKDAIVSAAMELFGRHGYRATTIAQIEGAAGLSPGAGGLYRHFRTKRAVLEEGLRRQAEGGHGLVAYLDDPATLPALPLRERLVEISRAGLRRLEEERDLNRILVRDLAGFPDLLAQVREQELSAVVGTVAEWLQAQPEPVAPGRAPDWQALASVLISAVSHYWILRDVYGGEHPHAVDTERYLNALADLAASIWASP